MDMTARAKRTLRDPAALAAAGLIARDRLAPLARVADRYAVAISPALQDLIDPRNPADPIARQFVPQEAELDVTQQERGDPIGDDAHSPVEGVVHRYPDRVLLKLVHICPVYCRFCFRREMVGPRGRQAMSAKAIAAACDYIRAHKEIWEVILSGGDPLMLSPRRLRAVMCELATIDHVKVLRVHSRVPIAAPERVTGELVRTLKRANKTMYIVLHTNHPRELTVAARAACSRFADAGFPMLAQTVLLRGVNDDVETLGNLMRALVESRVKPYYLHHADLAPGTAHLRTDVAEGQELMKGLRGRYSGLCQPSYVLDIPGGFGKVPIGPNYLTRPSDTGGNSARYLVEDVNGCCRPYPPDAPTADL